MQIDPQGSTWVIVPYIQINGKQKVRLTVALDPFSSVEEKSTEVITGRSLGLRL